MKHAPGVGTDTSFIDFLKYAVRGRQTLSLNYHGKDRHVTAWLLGEDKTGALVLHVYQMSPDPPGWRFLKVNEIPSANITKGISEPMDLVKSEKHENRFRSDLPPYHPPKGILKVLAP